MQGIQANGTLVARGTATQKIVFKPVEGTTPGSWGSIGFADSSVDATVDPSGNYTGGSVLGHCVISYGGGGSNGQISIDQSTPLISNCQILYSINRGIYINNAPAVVNIKDTEIGNCGNLGINGTGTSLMLENCDIVNNTNGGINLDNNSKSNATLGIKDCTISNNTGNGLYLYRNTTSTIENSSFSDNGGYGLNIQYT